MMYDLQKASLLKRASAFLLDFILLVVLATGVGMVVSGSVRPNMSSSTVCPST